MESVLLTCGKCKQEKPDADFNAKTGRSRQRQPFCRDCQSTLQKAYYKANKKRERHRGRLYYDRNKERMHAKSTRWREVNPKRYRATAVLRNYGLTSDQYEQLLEKQNGVCAICGQQETSKHKDSLSVDHDHDTNKIRGLLCFRCNCALGLLRESMSLLKSAVAYLENHQLSDTEES